MKKQYFLTDDRALVLMKQVKEESKHYIATAHQTRFFDNNKNVVTFETVSNGYLIELVGGTVNA